MFKQEYDLHARLTRARIAISDGRPEDGVEELRRAIFESAKLAPGEGRKNVEEILQFASENQIFEEVEHTLHDTPIRRHFFGES